MVEAIFLVRVVAVQGIRDVTITGLKLKTKDVFITPKVQKSGITEKVREWSGKLASGKQR